MGNLNTNHTLEGASWKDQFMTNFFLYIVLFNLGSH